MSPKSPRAGSNRRAAKPADDAAPDTTAADEPVDEPVTDDADSADTSDADDTGDAVKTRTVRARKRARRGAETSKTTATSKTTSNDTDDDTDDEAPKRANGAPKRANGAAKRTTTRKAAAPETKSSAKTSAKSKPAAGKPARGRKPGGRRPVAPVRVSKARPWGMIAMFTVVILIFGGIVGYTGYKAWVQNMSLPEKAQRIDGLVDYRSKDVKWLTRDHKAGKLTYQTSPPVGGDHNGAWEDCSGKVYTQQIPNEHAVHSLEHGAVWITYRPDLSAVEIAKLAKKVQGKDFMMLSPYPGLDKRISLQGWGFQLKVDSADDPRIDEFIATLRQKASVEPGAACSGGVTQTGTEPVDQTQQQGM